MARRVGGLRRAWGRQGNQDRGPTRERRRGRPGAGRGRQGAQDRRPVGHLVALEVGKRQSSVLARERGGDPSFLFFYGRVTFASIWVLPLAAFSSSLRTAETTQVMIEYPEEAYELQDARLIHIVYVPDETKINRSVPYTGGFLLRDAARAGNYEMIALPRVEDIIGCCICDICIELYGIIVSLGPDKYIATVCSYLSGRGSVINHVDRRAHKVSRDNYYGGDPGNSQFWAVGHSEFVARKPNLFYAVLSETSCGSCQADCKDAENDGERGYDQGRSSRNIIPVTINNPPEFRRPERQGDWRVFVGAIIGLLSFAAIYSRWINGG